MHDLYLIFDIMLYIVIHMTFFSACTCGIGWTRFRKSCYKLHATPAVFPSAYYDCVQQNAHVAVVNDVAELAFINTFSMYVYTDYPLASFIWFGAYTISE